jgi:YesN/AraC family two-component response regulator
MGHAGAAYTMGVLLEKSATKPKERKEVFTDDVQTSNTPIIYDNIRVTEYQKIIEANTTLNNNQNAKDFANDINANKVSDFEKAGIDNYLRDIYTYAKAQKPSSNILAICKAVELANLCATQFTSSDIKSENHSGNPLINKILVYLNEHFRENMTIEDISASFYVEKSYLSHLFKNHVGISLWNYVIYKRLNYFNDMICNGVSIEEACACAGFQNYSNFFRLYKKYTNTTPSEFKARINKG